MVLLVRCAIFLMFLSNGLNFQGASPSAQTPSSPEDGFVQQGKYTNRFFGFALQLPQDSAMHDLLLPSHDPRRKFLFGIQSQAHGLATLTISAIQSDSVSSDDAKRAVLDSKGGVPKRIEIGGKVFWKSESFDKVQAGKLRSVKYATPLAGYILEFTIFSFDSRLTDEFEKSIESIPFFDPAKMGG
jgi:hypothetical protein